LSILFLKCLLEHGSKIQLISKSTVLTGSQNFDPLLGPRKAMILGAEIELSVLTRTLKEVIKSTYG
jgi:VIT1/CCC1 family predicted Fe2+/Mn2+ transporter